MASLRCAASGVYYVEFRYQGHRLHRSLETEDETEARQLKSLVERTLKHIQQGVLTLTDSVTTDQLWTFLISGGKITDAAPVTRTKQLGAVCDEYVASFADAAKESSTLDTERHHVNHLQRALGRGTPFEAIGPSDLEAYIRRRQADQGIRGGKVKPVTIGKELATFHQIWEFAKGRGYVQGENPSRHVKKPRQSQKPPFMAWEEIERRIQRGGLGRKDEAELWDCLFLRESEIGEFLRHARQASAGLPRFPYVYPALAFCAYTGARRSEMFRCLVDDVHGTVMIREKKRQQDREITYREVPLHPELESVLVKWIETHPGGQFLFCKNGGQPLDDKTSREAFSAVTKNSKWSVLRGYHVLRHSFASNLARHGVDQYKIDEFMGHQTDEMRRRYRHLFPEDRKSAISVLSYGT